MLNNYYYSEDIARKVKLFNIILLARETTTELLNNDLLFYRIAIMVQLFINQTLQYNYANLILPFFQ